MLPRTVGAVVKNQTMIVLAPDASVRDAAKTMAVHGIGAVPVLEGGRLVGVFSERDLLNRIIARGLDPDTTKVAEVMTTDPETIDEGCNVVKALEAMLDGGFRHLPVTHQGRPIALLSLRDIPPEYWFIRENWKSAQRVPGNDHNPDAFPRQRSSGHAV